MVSPVEVHDSPVRDDEVEEDDEDNDDDDDDDDRTIIRGEKFVFYFIFNFYPKYKISFHKINSISHISICYIYLIYESEPIQISAASRIIIERIERFVHGIINDLKNGQKIQIVVQSRRDWTNCYVENER